MVGWKDLVAQGLIVPGKPLPLPKGAVAATPIIDEVIPEASGQIPTSALTKFFRTPQERAEAAGSIYGNLQRAVEEGDIENPIAREWGARAFREAKAAGLPKPTPQEREEIGRAHV